MAYSEASMLASGEGFWPSVVPQTAGRNAGCSFFHLCLRRRRVVGSAVENYTSHGALRAN